MVGVSLASKLAFGLAFSHLATASPVQHGSVEAGSVLQKRDTVTSSVNLGNNTGAPQHLASGTLYGIPNAINQIPDKFYSGIGWNYERAGGAQLPAPARGWIWGKKEYKNRFKSVLHNYKTTMNHGGKFIFLIHDLYGADGSQNSSTPYPGDSGDWTYWDDYLDNVISDMNKNNMLSNMIIDIWNEPDLGTVFWGRSQAQYLQMWGRTFARFRAAFGTQVLLSGPASAGEPLNNGWWNNWTQFVVQNNSVPDQIAWHMEGGGGDLLSAHGGLTQLQKTYGLPQRPLNINEYATYSEQVCSGLAWWISQLERIDAHGLLGQWLSGYQLHDYLATMLGKPHAGAATYQPTNKNYWPTGQWQMYHYYFQNMTGYRVGTLPSTDLKIDTYATVGIDRVVRVLTGVRISTGTWNVQLNNFTALGLPASGSLNIHTWGFPVGDSPHFGEVDGPRDLGYYSHPYTNNTVTFPVFQTDTTTAYAFTFSLDNRTVF